MMSTEHVERVLTLIQVSGQSGVLVFTPTACLEHAAWFASCMLREGSLLASQVTRRVDGGQLTGDHALAWLYQQPQAFWCLHPPASTAPREGISPHSALRGSQTAPLSAVDVHVVPQRTALGQSIPVRMIAREQRMIFILLDGHRSKADLLRLLSARQDVDAVLEQLAQHGLIAF